MSDVHKGSHVELRESMEKLQNNMGEHNDDTKVQDKIAKKSFQLLQSILKNADDDAHRSLCDDSIEYLEDILQCGLLVYAHNIQHMRMRRKWYQLKKDPFDAAKDLLAQIIHCVIKDHLPMVFRMVLDFITGANIWRYTYVCAEIFTMILHENIPVYIMMENLMQTFQSLLQKDAVENAKNLLEVFEAIIVADSYWSKTKGIDLNPWIRVYHASLSETGKKSKSELSKMSVQLSMCLKKIIGTMSSVELIRAMIVMMPLAFETGLPDDTIYEFGYCLEYAAKCHYASFVTLVTEPHFMDYILEQIASDSEVVSCMATRIFCRICDHSGNYVIFETPDNFYINTRYPIKVGIACKEAERFFKLQSRSIRDAVLSAIKKHSLHLANLRPIISMLQILVAEIPGGLTSTVATIIAINIQDFARAESKMPMRQSTHLHASVLSLMTLICWLHRPRTLSEYVNKIEADRAVDAPHLIPPLEIMYGNQYQTPAYKDELFFDEWTLRYGLWKRFRCNETIRSSDEKCKFK